MKEKVEFAHDTHKIIVISSPSGRQRMVRSGVGHYVGGTLFDPDASCQVCGFSSNEGTACTIMMSMQLRCERLLTGDCCHTREIKEFLGSCKGGRPEWVGLDGTAESGINERGEMFAILRPNGGTLPVPKNGLCHVFKKKIL